MKAVVYNGPRDVQVMEMPDPKIERPTDALVRITSTNICGSDLHMYEGRTSLEKGRIIGHENLGEVVEVGSALVRVKVGDRVCLPFNIACGFCRNCEKGFTGACLTMVPGQAGAAYGYADAGPFAGGQAEYLRVPFADFNCLKLPEDAQEKEDDYVMLSDIFPTGWHATRLAELMPGESVVIYGAGPVGLMAAHSAMIQGAKQVMIVDRHKDRLRLAEKIGAIAIDDSKDDPVEMVMQHTKGMGADKGCECVGFQCHDPAGHEVPNDTMNKLVQSVRATGAIGVVGVFEPKDPKPANKMAGDGQIAFDMGLYFQKGLFDMGLYFQKGLRMGSGQASVKRYNRELRDLIHLGRANPAWIVSHHLHLHEAPDAYKHFDNREDGWTKVILKPA